MGDDLNLWMEEAIREAEKGSDEGEVPVGAVLVGSDGTIVVKAHNQPIALKDPTAHAEILVLRAGGAFYGNYRIPGVTLVVTIEPCPMCVGAALQARISRLVFGAYDPKSGAAGSVYNLATDERLNHRIEVIPGVMEKECRELIKDFFRARRMKESGSSSKQLLDI